MVSPEITQLGVLMLGALAVASLVFTFAYPYLSGEKQTEKRLKGVTENRANRTARIAAAQQGAQRKQAVADTLKTIEEQQKKSKKVTMRTRLRRAGLDVSVKTFYVISLICGLVFGGGVYVMVPGLSLGALAIIIAVGSFGLPRWILSYLTKRRQNKFVNELPNAIDVIVRGVKSGLPLNECLGIIARESAEPLRSEFREILDEQRVGVTLGECFDRMCNRMPLPEVRFFAIVIAIQQSAGGNLSEALGNLSGVLRSRKQLRAKVWALSAEAKASAVVLAALPFVVMGLVYLSTPAYMEPLWTTTAGKFMLGCSAVWMTCGVLVMKKMINFKY
jgi:tight adherence protein B